ncbi:MAG TPA: hypothetical protein VH519_12830 [Hyphomicrobiaceae bacterium]
MISTKRRRVSDVIGPDDRARGERVPDMQPQAQGDANGAVLADADASVTAAQWRAAFRVVGSEFAWRLGQITLSRTGLADVVELIGRSQRALDVGDAGPLGGRAPEGDGPAILAHVLGSGDRGRGLAARVSRAAGWPGEIGMAMLPNLAVAALREVAAREGLDDILNALPALGRRSRGSPHADLADIVRRGCGAGPYAPAKLRRAVRRRIARAANFLARGLLGWYGQFVLLRPLSRLMRAFLARASSSRPAASDG